MMKYSILRILIALILSVSMVNLVFAKQFHYSTPVSQLIYLGQNYFKDPEGRVINYPCRTGGEPLVIYSSVDGQSISSQSVLSPVYLKPGYQATQLYIPAFEISDEHSLNNLIVQATNPAYGYISFDLSRIDGNHFYVDTANFPVVESELPEGQAVKYVSLLNVSINQLQDIFKSSVFPIYNNNNDESKELSVYSDVSEITANIASWNQTTRWSYGENRYFSNVAYRFSPIKASTGGVASYEGYGFWICGSDQIK